MARSLLFPKLTTQIISENWVTANDTFKKMEDIAMNNIKTIVSNNTVFIDELYKTKADSDGFVHDFKAGNKCKLCNGSSVNAIAGSSKAARGRRSNVNIYDEAGFISKETFSVTEPYAAQTSEFKLGSTFDAEVYPLEIPNIRLYIGSASDTNSNFYEKYKEGTKQMLVGSDKYFVADISCEIPKAPTVNGKKVKPLLSQGEIDRKMRENEIVAMREYYNIFDNFDLQDAVVSRSDIFSNTETFVPCLSWGGKKHKYIITYDPASKNDNAPVLVTEVMKDENKEWYGRTVHMENLVVTYGDGTKRPMRIDEQVTRLRELIYEYNGKENVAPYENVTVYLDAGVGGQAPAIAQELCKDWVDSNGRKHFGIYDEDSPDMVRWAEAYPHAIPGCLHLIEPRKYRNLMFEAAKMLVPLGCVKFSPVCPKFDTLVLDDGTERKLSKNEQNSLIQMDLMKEEIASMVRTKSAGTGNITYQLPPEKKNKMHDDRAYVFVLMCLYLKQLRDDEVLGDGAEMDFSVFYGKKTTEHSPINDPWLKNLRSQKPHSKNGSPFQGDSPFRR